MRRTVNPGMTDPILSASFRSDDLKRIPPRSDRTPSCIVVRRIVSILCSPHLTNPYFVPKSIYAIGRVSPLSPPRMAALTANKRRRTDFTITTPRSSLPPFLTALWDMVESEDNNGVISWTRNGTAFAVHDPEAFELVHSGIDFVDAALMCMHRFFQPILSTIDSLAL
jgi:hypothetical protein